MPKVSVIIATYNRAHLIGRALKTVLEQTYDDFEVIIVDDGSTDSTEDVIKGFDDARIKYIRHDKNRGAAAAWNTGIRASSGEYIAFQDSDDEWVKDKLEKQMNVFRSAPPEVGVVFTGRLNVKHTQNTYSPDAVSFPELRNENVDFHRCLLRQNFAITPTTVIKKECFCTAGMFDEEIPRFQQWELLIRISKYYSFKFIDEPLLINHQQPDSLSADPVKTMRGWEIVFRKHREEFTADKELLIYRYTHIGKLLFIHGAPWHSRRYFLKAAFVDSLNIRVSLPLFITAIAGPAASPAIYSKLKTFLRKFLLKKGDIK